MKNLAIQGLLLLLALAGAGCGGEASKAINPPDSAGIQCSEQRPQICTFDYNPVCAERDTGIRCVTTPCPSSKWKTQSNACAACADKKVSRYIPGACEATETPTG